MKSKDIREEFLRFFKNKGHQIISSSSMVVKNDPTLMFTNAGMNQFKDLFLGNSDVKYARISDTQKCLRVSGKHNDLDEVGYDTYHHTMFEMLGNWSFGDYFKEEAIKWAWELLTEVYKIDEKILYVSVFEGDKDDKLDFDQESYDIWKKYISEDRIIRGNKNDNFWEMGDIGPCGPCSEIHIDIRPEKERVKLDGYNLVNSNHPEVVELWNLVFMQYNRTTDGSLEKLPKTHVDTGMGLERLCMVLQGVSSNYDSDVFQPLIKKLSFISNQSYGVDKDIDIAMRVVVDHIRAIAFSIADGQLPSNTGAGYVIRRILRRAVRYGFTFLEFKEPFLYKLIEILESEMGDQFPELKKERNLIQRVIEEEESSFLKTLDKGISLFNDLLIKNNTVSGKDAFELYDTFGFPIDLTQLIASEKGYIVDVVAFNKFLEKQKHRSRKATQLERDDWTYILEDDIEEFIGYDNIEAEVKITRYRRVKQKNKEFFQLVFNCTPFYPEGGGQVGDIGYIESNNDRVGIFDTKKENNLIVHYVESLPKNLNLSFQAIINFEHRLLSSRNHTATHLLHEVLRQVLGDHVEQKGSLLDDKSLRFDFSHFKKLTNQELLEIEEQVNSKIRANIFLEEHRAITMQKAEKMGAIALFGEKYSDVVRCIQFGTSIELCGGIHVSSTGEIGLFKIISESAVASGVRRIEAVTAQEAINFYNNSIEKIDLISTLIKSNNVVKGVQDLLKENLDLNKKVAKVDHLEVMRIKSDLVTSKKIINGISFISANLDLDFKNIKTLAFEIKKEQENLFLVLTNYNNEKANIIIVVSENISNSKKIHAGNIITELSKYIKGGGGGQSCFATAGGTYIEGISKVLNSAEEIVQSLK